MAVRVKVTNKGMEEALEELVRMGRNIDQVADDMVLAGGEVYLGGMRERVAKDTRNLESKLAVDGPHQDGNFHWAEVGLPKTTDADTARYGTAQEYGTANMPAHPYIRPTIDSDTRKARKAMVDVARKAAAE